MRNNIPNAKEKVVGGAKFTIASTSQKKRSQSENRNRQLDMNFASWDNDYFTNKLRSTIKVSEDKNENDMFFSKRKANQQLNLSKTTSQRDWVSRAGHSLSEKKPTFGVNLLNCNGMATQHVSAFDIQDIGVINIRQAQLEKTSQFGGNEYNISSSNSSIHTSDEYFWSVARSEKKNKLNWMSGTDVNNLFNWTFFPKGKHFMWFIDCS